MVYKFKSIRSDAASHSRELAECLLQFNFYVDEEDLVQLSLSETEREMRRDFLAQVRAAFSAKPDLNGVIHGVRKIRLGKEGSRSSHFPSTKNSIGGLHSVSLLVESRMEARYAIELERDVKVRAFRTQAIELTMPGLDKSIYPDFLVIDQAGYLHIREVKQNAKLLSPEKVEHFKHVKRGLSKWGVTFALVDATNVSSDHKYENLQLLNKIIQVFPHEEEVSEFLGHSFSKSTYGELKQIATSMALDESIVSYLLFTEALTINWEKLLDDKSEVTR